MTATIIYAVMWILFGIGYYVGRSSAKDKHYIKGYRDGINGGKSIQEIISKIKEDA